MLGTNKNKSNIKDDRKFSPCMSGSQDKLSNPLTLICDQDRISHYNINTISSRQVMRVKKNIS